MKKILILTAYNPLEWSWIEKVMNEVWKALGNSWKYSVTYLFSWDWKNKESNWIYYKSIRTPKVRWVNYIIYCLKLSKYIKKEKPDLMIDNMWSSFFYLFFGRGKNRQKIISVCHGTPRDFKYAAKFFHFNSIIEKIINYLVSFIGYYTHSYCIKKSDLIITLSKELKARLIDKLDLPEYKVHIIYNWYDPKNIDIKRHNWIKALFISNDHIRKWIDILENVANYYINNDNIKFYVIWKDYNSKHKNIISKWKMERDKLYNFMAESDIIFLPSYCEWQPLVILEAMWFGCIPVISKECHMDMLYSTLFEKYISEENSAKDYINQIDDIMNQKDLLSIRKLSKETISNFTWDIQSQQYLNLIDNFINN